MTSFSFGLLHDVYKPLLACNIDIFWFGKGVTMCVMKMVLDWPKYILGDPGAVSRVRRKGATKVFKDGRKSPGYWLPPDPRMVKVGRQKGST